MPAGDDGTKQGSLTRRPDPRQAACFLSPARAGPEPVAARDLVVLSPPSRPPLQRRGRGRAFQSLPAEPAGQTRDARPKGSSSSARASRLSPSGRQRRRHLDARRRRRRPGCLLGASRHPGRPRGAAARRPSRRFRRQDHATPTQDPRRVQAAPRDAFWAAVDGRDRARAPRRAARWRSGRGRDDRRRSCTRAAPAAAETTAMKKAEAQSSGQGKQEARRRRCRLPADAEARDARPRAGVAAREIDPGDVATKARLGRSRVGRGGTPGPAKKAAAPPPCPADSASCCRTRRGACFKRLPRRRGVHAPLLHACVRPRLRLLGGERPTNR